MTHSCYHFHSAVVTAQEDNMHQACTQYTPVSCASRSPANKQSVITHGAPYPKGANEPTTPIPCAQQVTDTSLSSSTERQKLFSAKAKKKAAHQKLLTALFSSGPQLGQGKPSPSFWMGDSYRWWLLMQTPGADIPSPGSGETQVWHGIWVYSSSQLLSSDTKESLFPYKLLQVGRRSTHVKKAMMGWSLGSFKLFPCSR